MNHSRTFRPSRRAVLAAGFVAATGCRSEQSKDAKSSGQDAGSTGRIDVPLRIALVGSQSQAEALKLAWAMSSSQPLEITVVPSLRSADSDAVPKMSKAIASSDVAIYPQLAVGTVAKEKSAVEFTETTLGQLKTEIGPPLTAVRLGLGRYGGRTWGVPLGGKLFATLSVDSNAAPETWADYHQWIATTNGKASEPLGKGWAASAYLNRCATSIDQGWLFDRADMTPELSSEPYVAVLEQLNATSKLYNDNTKTPGEVWLALRSGELKAGIGYEVASRGPANAAENDEEMAEEFDVSVASCPVQTQSDRLWFDSETPLAVIGSACRQTDASKRFIAWLAGRQGNQTLSRQIESFSATRDETFASGTTESGSARVGQESEYSRWLATRLRTRQVVVGLVLPGAEAYYRALDQQITDCIAGKVSPTDALKNATRAWEQITEKLGRDNQAAAWRKSV